ncbi:BA14K family protein [Aquibium oceanicum]|uniref:Lectin-like protein BA14k n=1 Tax=Aquibium oceanicum TaxID=1670800 RepID=A0A1L3SLT6_9HYPH|nr:BA14K family protein [Aquibium oceanicum]APH70363.1 hypothetical protein BSQ44_02425 [Aquibium oceanicum]
MNKILTTFSAALLSVSMAAPLAAAPIAKPAAPEAGTLLQDVQYRNWRDSSEYRPRGGKNYGRHDRGRFERRGNSAYYHGHRGYRQQRPGYREYNGFWFPAAAFLAGSLITGAITADRNRGGNAHVEWCHDRYRSYRASDNTFQPYNGPRQQCYSPYS